MHAWIFPCFIISCYPLTELIPLPPPHTHTRTVIGAVTLNCNVYCIVGLYRLFGLSVIVAYPFWSLYHPSTECAYRLTDAYHLQTLRTAYIAYYIMMVFTAVDIIERFSFCSEDIVWVKHFWDGSTFLIITVSLFSEGSLFIVFHYLSLPLRYYVAEGVRLYSQETWRVVTQTRRVQLVEQHIHSSEWVIRTQMWTMYFCSKNFLN